MAAPSRLTELDVVNACLEEIHEAPIQSLVGQTSVLVAVAQRVYNEVTRSVLLKGWNFNTDNEVTLSPDGSNNILLGVDFLKADPCDISLPYIWREGKLWDHKKNTDVFTDDVDFDIVRSLDFEDIPAYAQEYIKARTVRTFYGRSVGKGTADYQVLQVDEQDAYAEMRRGDIRSSDANLLRNSKGGARRVMNRRI